MDYETQSIEILPELFDKLNITNEPFLEYELINLMKSEEDILQLKIIEFRRVLHMYPELSFQEHKTAQFINNQLQHFGFNEIYTGLAGTGVVAVLRGQIDESILFRADMDALPLKEQTNLKFKSKNDGVMHACGHDGHVAMLLGFACSMMQKVKCGFKLKRGIKFCFQPAEENGSNGAHKMINDNALYDVLETSPKVINCFGMHITTHLDSHQLGYQIGPVTASSDKWEIVIKGRGGHAMCPETTVDALQIGVQIVNSIYQIRGRNTSQTQSCTISVGKFIAGEAANCITEQAIIVGQVRSLRKEDSEGIFERMKKICQGAQIQHDCTVTFNQFSGYQQVYNDPKLRQVIQDALEKVGTIIPTTLGLAGEDFYNFSSRKPSAFIVLGAAHQGALECNTPKHLHHSPEFDFNEETLITGVKVWHSIVNQYQSQSF